MLRAPHSELDVADGGYIPVVKDRQYVSINNTSAGSETRILMPPTQPGLRFHLGCIVCAANSVIVTVQQIDTSTNVASTTGTVTFTAAGQWIGLESYELSAGVYAWQCSDVYGCSTTIQTAQNWSAAVAAGTMTTLVVSQVSAQSIVNTALTAPSIVGTNLTAASTATINKVSATSCSAASVICTALTAGTAGISSNLTAANMTATGLNATSVTAGSGSFTSTLTAAAFTGTGIVAGTGGVNCTAGKVLKGAQLAMTGGTAATSAQAITAQNAFLAFTASTNNFYSLPTSAQGLEVNVINRVGSTAVLVAANATQSIQGATSFSVATSNAVGGAPKLVCDGTNWFRGAQ
jgi:hypothetical protein